MISDNAPLIKATVIVSDVIATRDALRTAISELEREIDRVEKWSEGQTYGATIHLQYALNALEAIDNQLAAAEAAQ